MPIGIKGFQKGFILINFKNSLIIKTMEKEKDLKDAQDSINLINSFKGKKLTDEEKEIIQRNNEHLKIIIARHKLKGKESEPFETAIKTGEKIA